MLKELEVKTKLNIIPLRIEKSEFAKYLQRWDYQRLYSKNKEEKALEHFVSIKLLKFNTGDVFIDIASANSPFPRIISEVYGCNVYRQDMVYPYGVNGMNIGGDASALPIESNWVSKMTLHCSFEHFEGDADMRFIKEVSRVLKPGGMVCILPLYLRKEYCNLSDPAVDRTGLVFDKGAAIKEVAGWDNRFGRIYSIDKFKERILNNCGDLESAIYFLENEKDAHQECYLKFILILKKPLSLVGSLYSNQQVRSVKDTKSKNGYQCLVCESYVSGFLVFGVIPRPNAKCPVCGSLERHRLIWLYFRERTNLFRDKLKMLHIAPEGQISKLLKGLPNLEYISADIVPGKAMVQMDITAINYPDESFDVIYASHVLEHIPDDRKAMRELYRVLKPGGWAILQVPIWGEKTIEDPTITSPEEREKVFGQHDHVRRYGWDNKYKERLEKTGFIVKTDSFVKTLDKKLIDQYALMATEDIYFCRKKII